MKYIKLLRRMFRPLKILLLRVRYALTLFRLRKKIGRTKIKVGFFISEVAKWKGQSLYDALSVSDKFEPIMLIYPMGVEAGDCLNSQRDALALKETFFHQKGMSVRCIWNYEKQKCLAEYISDIDILFYQQPWDIPPAPRPLQVASHALTFYFPYFVVSYENSLREANRLLHYEVFRHVMLNEKQINHYGGKHSKLRYAGKMVPLGHPLLDQFNKYSKNLSKNCVIYAPHFSFPTEKEHRTFLASTFLENGRLILDFAMHHPELHWVFKPHPRLRRELVDTQVWTKEEVDEYFSAWEKIGTACYTSDYIELFLDSRVMITDCGSFLSEYSCTGNPLIHLIPGKLPLPPNPAVEKLFSLFYQAPDLATLQKWLQFVVVDGNDPRRSERLACLKDTGLLNSHAAENIMNYMQSLLE